MKTSSPARWIVLLGLIAVALGGTIALLVIFLRQEPVADLETTVAEALREQSPGSFTEEDFRLAQMLKSNPVQKVLSGNRGSVDYTQEWRGPKSSWVTRSGFNANLAAPCFGSWLLRQHSRAARNRGAARLALPNRQRGQRFAVTRLEIRLRRRGYVQVAQQPVANVVNPAMHRELLATAPRILNDGRLSEIPHLLDDVEFAKPVRTQRVIDDAAENVLVLHSNILHVPQPIVREPHALAPQRCAHATAAVVPTQDDVLHLQNIDRELHHRQGIQVRVHEDIGNVAMHEQFSGHQVHDFIRGHSAVRAANPKVLRALLSGELLKEFRIAPANVFSPAAIAREQFG